MAMKVIRTIEDLINMLELQKLRIETYKVEVGATQDDIDEIDKLLTDLVTVRDYAEGVDAGKKTVTKIKQDMFDGEIGAPIAKSPVFEPLVFATPPVAGARPTSIARNKRFMLGPKYSLGVGVALGIEIDSPDPIVPDTITPTIKVSGAQTGSKVEITVGNRGESDMWRVEILRKGGAEWEFVDKFSGKMADVEIKLTTPGQSEQIQVRIQLIKGNLPYGNLSLAATVTVNP